MDEDTDTRGSIASKGDDGLHELTEALNAIYNPHSTNETRKDATQYLERAKTQADAANRGFKLAADQSQPAHVRHFGLALVEYTMKYRWDELQVTDIDMFKDSIVVLAKQSSTTEPAFLRNKLAQLWVDLVQRIWPEGWVDFDYQLVSLWGADLSHQFIVLYVLEVLAEDAFSTQDKLQGFHETSIGKECTEIFTPAKTFSELFPSRDQTRDLRAGEEGWIARLVQRLSQCCSTGTMSSQGTQEKALIVQVLNTLRATMPWILTKVLSDTNFIEVFGRCLQTGDIDIQIVRSPAGLKWNALS